MILKGIVGRQPEERQAGGRQPQTEEPRAKSMDRTDGQHDRQEA